IVGPISLHATPAGRARSAAAARSRDLGDQPPDQLHQRPIEFDGPRPLRAIVEHRPRHPKPVAQLRALARFLRCGEGTGSGPIFKTGPPSRGWEGLSIVRCPCRLSTLRGPFIPPFGLKLVRKSVRKPLSERYVSTDLSIPSSEICRHQKDPLMATKL